MRTKRSIYNVIITFIYYIVVTLIGLFLRKVFLETLGVGYVGLDSVFANILSLLGLVELGIGPAITYRLYKPLAEDDHKTIGLLMNVYKKFYRYVAFAVIILGIIISFFLPLIVNEPPVSSNLELTVCYFLYMSSTIASYFFAYKRSLLVADQQQYVTLLIDTLFNIIVFIAKIIVLKLTGSYMLVLIINTLRVVFGNLAISIKCNKTYPYLKKYASTDKKTIKETAKDMVVDIKYILIHKFCNYVYSSTDGIVISSFMGVNSVGFLANYNLIVNVVNNVFMQCASSIQSSIGNLVNTVKDNLEPVKENLRRLSYIYYSILNFTCISLFCLLSPFIEIWLGEEFLLSTSIVLVICINLFIYSFYQPIANIYTVLGLFKKDKFTSALAAIVNIVVSVAAVFILNYFYPDSHAGLIGVYFGTILGSLIYFIFRTNIVYKKYFKESPKSYYLLFLRYLIVTFITGTITYIIISFMGSGIVWFCAKILVCILVPNLINILIFRKTNEFKYVKNLINNIIHRRKD